MDSNHTPTSSEDMSTEKVKAMLNIILLSLLNQESSTSQEKQDANMKEIYDKLQAQFEGCEEEGKMIEAGLKEL